MQLAQLVIDAVSPAVEALGWVRIEREDPDEHELEFLRVRSSEIGYQTGIALRDQGSVVALTSSLGVEHLRVQSLVATFEGLEQEGWGGVCSLGTNLADLLLTAGIGDPWLRWTVRSPREVSRLVDTLCADLTQFGKPYLDRIGDLDDLVSALRAVPRHPERRKHFAVACALTGRVDEAASELATYVGEESAVGPRFAAQARQFVMGFAVHFGMGEDRIKVVLNAAGAADGGVQGTTVHVRGPIPGHVIDGYPRESDG